MAEYGKGYNGVEVAGESSLWNSRKMRLKAEQRG
jgi:hypothetical protein